MKIALLSASIVGNKNKVALNRMQSEMLVKYPTHKMTFLDLKEMDICFSDGRDYYDYTGDTLRLTTTLMDADIIIIATPTSQASIPGCLKNVFDLLPRNAFFGKVVSLIVSASSSKHYLMAENQLKPILNYMKAIILPNYVFIEEADIINNYIINDDIRFRIESLLENTMDLAKNFKELSEAKELSYEF